MAAAEEGSAPAETPEAPAAVAEEVRAPEQETEREAVAAAPDAPHQEEAMPQETEKEAVAVAPDAPHQEEVTPQDTEKEVETAAADAAQDEPKEEEPKAEEQPKPEEDAAAKEKARILEEFKAKMRSAAQGVPKSAFERPKKPNQEASKTFCLCVAKLAKESGEQQELYAEFSKALPRLGEERLAYFLGLAKASEAPDNKPGSLLGGARMQGRVKSYNTKKGFGFIDMPGYQRDIFVFNAHLIGRIGLLAGESVEYSLTMDDGRPQARQVRVVAGTNGQSRPGIFGSGPMGVGSGPGLRDLTLAMAAAAAEVPTTLPSVTRLQGAHQKKSQEDILADQIREAQLNSATDKRKDAARTTPQEGADAIRAAQVARAAQVHKEGGIPWQQGPQGPQGMQVASGGGGVYGRSMQQPAGVPAVPEKGEGSIPNGAKVRVRNFPAAEVNNCLGVVEGFDAETGKYSVAVEMSSSGESQPKDKVPLQLREDCLTVESIPPLVAARRAAAASAVPVSVHRASSSGPGGLQGPAHPVGGVAKTGSALQKSANEALQRFQNMTAMHNQQQQQQQHHQQQQVAAAASMQPVQPLYAQPPLPYPGSGADATPWASPCGALAWQPPCPAPSYPAFSTDSAPSPQAACIDATASPQAVAAQHSLSPPPMQAPNIPHRVQTESPNMFPPPQAAPTLPPVVDTAEEEDWKSPPPASSPKLSNKLLTSLQVEPPPVPGGPPI